MKKCPHDLGKNFKKLNDAVPYEFKEECDCGLKPKHVKGEHDWCCQVCGGSHTERICPVKKK